MNINATLIGQAIWFALFIWITMKYVWPPLQKAMADRQAQIAEGLAAAERSKTELELASKRSAESLREAKEKAAEVVAQADRTGGQIVEEAKVRAKEEADRIVAAAKAEIEQEVARAKEALRNQVSSLAVAGAERILKREVNAQAHADLLKELQSQV